jgi:hypothetical protein
MKKIITGVLGLVVGLGLVAFAAYLLTSAPVKCGSDVMKPGNTCTIVDKGRAQDRSYEEQQSSQHTDGYYALAPGAILVGYGIWALVTARRTDDASDDDYAMDDYPTPAV